MKATLLEEGEQGVGLDSTGFYDQEIYGGSDSRFAGYVTSIAANEQEDVRIFHPRAETHVLDFPVPPLSMLLFSILVIVLHVHSAFACCI